VWLAAAASWTDPGSRTAVSCR